MKKLIALLFAAISINAAAVEYRAATTDSGETIVFSNLACPFGTDLSIARVITKDADVFVCYGVMEKEIVLFSEGGDLLRIPKDELHLMKQTGI
jgi:hypothetical protein